MDDVLEPELGGARLNANYRVLNGTAHWCDSHHDDSARGDLKSQGHIEINGRGMDSWCDSHHTDHVCAGSWCKSHRVPAPRTIPVIAITFLNQKGGVGKTSSCFHLGGALARAGWRVLLIDNDPQASLTQGFFGPEATSAIPPEASIAALYDPEAAAIPETLVVPTPIPGISLVPGSIALADWNVPIRIARAESLASLRGLLEAVEGSFDLVLIDCPPNLYLCATVALVASSRIVVPLQAEDFGSQGLAPVQAAVTAVQAGPNPDLRLAGYLLTMYDKRLAVHRTYETILRQLYGTDVFEAVVPRAKDFVEAVAHRTPLAVHKPKGDAAKSVAALAEELLARVGLVDQSERGAA